MGKMHDLANPGIHMQRIARIPRLKMQRSCQARGAHQPRTRTQPDPPAEARGPTKEQLEPPGQRSNSSWSSDEDYVDSVLSNDLSNVANAIGDDANPADGQYSREVQIHLSQMTNKIEHADDLLPNLVRIDEYARLLPKTLVHLQTPKQREILPWLMTQRKRIVALITPEEGKTLPKSLVFRRAKY